MTSSLYGHKAASVVTHVSRPELRPGGDSWSSSRRTSPHPGVEKHTGKTQSRKSSFLWSLKKSESECSLVEHKHGWKPVTLTAPVLVPFAVISLLLAAILEVLAQQSSRAGGLALSPSADDFPALVTFSYLFLPTIIAVIYSLFWSWVDLDAKRIQPWFEMSKEAGASAGNSILLAYPYDFVGTVPFKAIKRRHWPVFCAGTTMVIIFWLVTPLQSAIFGTGSVAATRSLQLQHSLQFLPPSEQPIILDQSIMNEGYANTWLNQPLPPFTAPNYTVIPFTAISSRDVLPSTNWTGESTRYWTELECWPANYARQGPKARKTFSFDNGRGCNVSEIAPYGSPDGSSPWKMLYIGYQTSPSADYSLKNPNCSADAAHQHLAIWSYYNVTIDEIDLRASFCEASYFKQRAQVTVSARNLSLAASDFTALEAPQPLTETEFNITAFEYLIGAGVSSVEEEVERDYPFGRALEQYFRVNDFRLSWPMSPMVGFAVGSQNITTLDAFNDTQTLENAFRTTQKLIFSLALRQTLTNATDIVTSEGQLQLELHGVIVSRLFSAITEGLLLLIAILVLMLAYFCHVSPCNLTEDPSSLGSLIDVCRDSSDLLNELTGKGALAEEDFAHSFSDQKFRLKCGCHTRHRQMVIEVLNQERGDATENLRVTCEDVSAINGHYKPVQPWALRRDVGAAILLVMTGALVVLSYFKHREQIEGGLARPSTSFEVMQIILNYLPTVFATFLEPFWVLVNRLLCILQPFRDLWAGQRPAKGSIRARYTSVPPQLVFWRAAGARHFLLVALSGIALLSNLLAVGLGGIFNELPVKIQRPRNFEQTLLPQMSNDTVWGLDFVLTVGSGGVDFRYEDHFYVAMSNFSRGTPLPPWVGTTHFFHPFTVSDEPSQGQPEAESYTALTRGFGVNALCEPAGTFTTTGTGPTLDITLERDGSTVPGCAGNYSAESLALNSTRYVVPSGQAAVELVDTPSPGTKIQACDVPLILGWARSTEARDSNGQMESSFIICKPVFDTAVFEVTVNPQGYILNSLQKTDSKTTMDYPESTNNTDTFTTVINHIIKRPAMNWHNNTLSQDWMNYLLKINPGNEAVLDPTADLPDLERLAKSASAVYSQIYAITLGLNPDIFISSPGPIIIPGIEHATETKIFMPLSAFIISAVVLGLNILTAIVLYAFAIKNFLPRMPTSIGSTLAYLAPSRAVREYSLADDDERRSATFSFGRYIGDDGRAHLGIEMDPYVVPVKLASLKKGDTQPSTSRLRRAFTREKSSSGGDTWL